MMNHDLPKQVNKYLTPTYLTNYCRFYATSIIIWNWHVFMNIRYSFHNLASTMKLQTLQTQCCKFKITNIFIFDNCYFSCVC